MIRASAGLVFVLALSAAGSAAAGETCTIEYRVDATFEVSDTHLNKGDRVVPARGSLVVEYPVDGDGRVADGKVKVLHYAMYEEFTIETLVTVTTTVHHYAPACNGVEEPTWRRRSDPGFPRSCAYTGGKTSVAVGKLDRALGLIEWAKCKPAPTYWSESRDAYRPSDKSKGRGCLERMHAAGNIGCDGRLACRLGGLERGDNPQYGEWTQPLVIGPDETKSFVSISRDLRTIQTPPAARGSRRSYNLPNEAPSRTWFSFAATRSDASRFTTCPR